LHYVIFNKTSHKFHKREAILQYHTLEFATEGKKSDVSLYVLQDTLKEINQNAAGKTIRERPN